MLHARKTNNKRELKCKRQKIILIALKLRFAGQF